MTLDVLVRVLFAVSLSISAVWWFLVMAGKCQPRQPVELSGLRRADRGYMFAVAAFLLAIALGLIAGDTGNYAGILLAGLALGGWAQERLMRTAPAKVE